MKKGKIFAISLVALFTFALFAAIFSTNIVRADEVNLEINVNGTANLNITVDADDTEAREAIEEIEEDLYGNETGSGPEDIIIGGMDEEKDAVVEICNDPELQQYFNEVALMPPAEFREHLKALGYDDETHVNTIWNLCQQKYIQEREKYIQEHEGIWSADLFNAEGISANALVSYIQGAIAWLTGKTGTPPQYIDIATALDSYFASDQDLAMFANQIAKELDMIYIRLEALELTMEEIASDDYCEVKIAIMEKYNLTKVKCGEHSTWYYMVPDENSEKGYYIMGITPVENTPTTTTTTLPPCVEDWICTDWSECTDEFQIRTCVDMNECGTAEQKPNEWQICGIPENQVLTTVSGLFAQMSANPAYPILISLFVAPATFVVLKFRLFGSKLSRVGSKLSRMRLKVGREAKLLKKRSRIKAPELRIKKPLIKINRPKIKMPSLNMPSVTLPELTLPTLPELTLPKMALPKINFVDTLNTICLIIESPFKYFSKIIPFTKSKLSWPFEKIGLNKKGLGKMLIKKFLNLL